LYPFSSHKMVIDILNKKDNQNILDVGCGDGLLAEHISERNKKTGVDFIPPSENTNKNFNLYFQFDLNKGLPEEIKEEKPFDYILFLDILEHLHDFESILEESRELLGNEGKIIVSLPNFVNIYVRLNILLGRLPLADKGILDRTHLHLFTYGIIVKMLNKNRFEIISKKITPIPIIEVLPDFLKKNLGYVMNYMLFLMSQFFKRTFGYQFIFICKAKK